MIDGNKKTIVLIEDEEDMVTLLTNILTAAGYTVRSALDGVAGLQLIHNEKPALVLLDMMLPRLNGFGVLEKLHEEKLLPDLPVIIISNSGQPIEIDRALKLGVKDYLIKVNFEINEVIAKVNLIFGESTGHNGKDTPPIATVLIVEDDTFLVDLLERKFTRSHIKAFVAMDAEHARLILAREKVDAILLEVILAGMDGITFLKELKTDDRLKSLPVIVISNLGQTEEIKKGMSAGASAYIIKANATPAEILSKVLELIKK